MPFRHLSTLVTIIITTLADRLSRRLHHLITVALQAPDRFRLLIHAIGPRHPPEGMTAAVVVVAAAAADGRTIRTGRDRNLGRGPGRDHGRARPGGVIAGIEGAGPIRRIRGPGRRRLGEGVVAVMQDIVVVVAAEVGVEGEEETVTPVMGIPGEVVVVVVVVVGGEEVRVTAATAAITATGAEAEVGIAVGAEGDEDALLLPLPRTKFSGYHTRMLGLGESPRGTGI